MAKYKEIRKCRICGNDKLDLVLSLGEQSLTGVFPKRKDQPITAGPLELVKCRETGAGEHCGLLQLRHSYDDSEMYGDNYGYRSGLNQSMVKHLQDKVRKILGVVTLKKSDLVVDIGSNDATLLKAYPQGEIVLAGIDPTGSKYREYYPDYIKLIPELFNARLIKEKFGEKKAKIITSIAMFYDLESPMAFVEQIAEILADDGVWVLEQSYMPTMLTIDAYDTVCHEHLEYYALKQIKWLTDRAGLKIVDVDLNSVNGGSFSVMVAKSSSAYKENTKLINELLAVEETAGLRTLAPYQAFALRVADHKKELLKFIAERKKKGEKIFAYGASTKGNVILQYCHLTEQDIPAIAEVNSNKFGSFTPGTLIPIISEAEARAQKPDYFMVLPWHFRDGIVEREKEYLNSGGKLFFPLPKLEVVSK